MTTAQPPLIRLLIFSTVPHLPAVQRYRWQRRGLRAAVQPHERMPSSRYICAAVTMHAALKERTICTTVPSVASEQSHRPHCGRGPLRGAAPGCRTPATWAFPGPVGGRRPALKTLVRFSRALNNGGFTAEVIPRPNFTTAHSHKHAEKCSPGHKTGLSRGRWAANNGEIVRPVEQRREPACISASAILPAAATSSSGARGHQGKRSSLVTWRPWTLRAQSRSQKSTATEAHVRRRSRPCLPGCRRRLQPSLQRDRVEHRRRSLRRAAPSGQLRANWQTSSTRR